MSWDPRRSDGWRFVDAAKWAGSRMALLLDSGLGSRQKASPGILLYHRVTNHAGETAPPTMNVGPRAFERQMMGLLGNGYTIWPLSHALMHADKGRPFPSKVAILTFDDGYHNVYTYAWPVMRRLKIPATIFVSTAYVGGSTPFPFDKWANTHGRNVASESWLPIRWEECSEMEASGLIEIGSHSHTHADFRGKLREFERDVRASVSTLNEHLGSKPRPFAFPFGSISKGFADPSLATIVEDAGLTCALTTEIGLVRPGTSHYAWPRIEVDGRDTSATIRAKLDGWYSWMNAGRRAYWELRRSFRSVLRIARRRSAASRY